MPTFYLVDGRLCNREEYLAYCCLPSKGDPPSEAERFEQERFNAATKYKLGEYFGLVTEDGVSFRGAYFYSYVVCISSTPLWVWGSQLMPDPTKPGAYKRVVDYSVAVLLHKEDQ